MSFLAATYSSILLHGDVVSVTSAVEQDGADHVIYKRLCLLKNDCSTESLKIGLTPQPKSYTFKIFIMNVFVDSLK